MFTQLAGCLGCVWKAIAAVDSTSPAPSFPCFIGVENFWNKLPIPVDSFAYSFSNGICLCFPHKYIFKTKRQAEHNPFGHAPSMSDGELEHCASWREYLSHRLSKILRAGVFVLFSLPRRLPVPFHGCRRCEGRQTHIPWGALKKWGRKRRKHGISRSESI